MKLIEPEQNEKVYEYIVEFTEHQHRILSQAAKCLDTEVWDFIQSQSGLAAVKLLKRLNVRIENE